MALLTLDDLQLQDLDAYEAYKGLNPDWEGWKPSVHLSIPTGMVPYGVDPDEVLGPEWDDISVPEAIIRSLRVIIEDPEVEGEYEEDLLLSFLGEDFYVTGEFYEVEPEAGYGQFSELIITHADYEAFAMLYPHVVATGPTRETYIQTLKAGNSVNDLSEIATAAAKVSAIVSKQQELGLHVPEPIVFEVVEGATHYITKVESTDLAKKITKMSTGGSYWKDHPGIITYIPMRRLPVRGHTSEGGIGGDPENYRLDFIVSDGVVKIPNIGPGSQYHGDSLGIDYTKALLDAEADDPMAFDVEEAESSEQIEAYLTPGSAVYMLEHGLGQNGRWARVRLIKKADGAIGDIDVEGYIDAYFLTRAGGWDAPIVVNDAEFNDFPIAGAPDPNPDAYIPDWKLRDECGPFFNPRTNEYWITVRTKTPAASSAALDSVVMQAKEKGVISLFKYYDKLCTKEVIQKFLSVKIGDVEWASHEYWSNPERPGDELLVLVKMPKTHFDHKIWNRAIHPDYGTLEKTIAEFAASGLVAFEYVFKPKDIDEQIEKLVVNVRRIGELAKTKVANPAVLPNFDDVIKHIEAFPVSMKKFLEENDVVYDKDSEQEITIAFDSDLDVLYALYTTGATLKPSRFLNVGVRCLTRGREVE